MPSIGYLAKIEFSATQGGTYAALMSAPTMVSIPSVEVEMIPSHHLQSASAVKTYIAGFRDVQPVSYEAQYEKADYLAIKAIEGLVRWFKVSSPDGTALTATFPGVLHKIETEFVAEELTKMKFEIRPTGAVTVA